MKAITFLICFALIALASAQTTNSFVASTITASYGWWMDLTHTGVTVFSYLTCLSGGWVAAFLFNDGGFAFLDCLVTAGVRSVWAEQVLSQA